MLDMTETPVSISLASKWQLSFCFCPGIIGMIYFAIYDLSSIYMIVIRSLFSISTTLLIISGIVTLDLVTTNFFKCCFCIVDSRRYRNMTEMVDDLDKIRLNYETLHDAITIFLFYSIIMFSINFTLDTYYSLESIINKKIMDSINFLCLSLNDICMLHLMARLSNNSYNQVIVCNKRIR